MTLFNAFHAVRSLNWCASGNQTWSSRVEGMRSTTELPALKRRFTPQIIDPRICPRSFHWILACYRGDRFNSRPALQFSNNNTSKAIYTTDQVVAKLQLLKRSSLDILKGLFLTTSALIVLQNGTASINVDHPERYFKTYSYLIWSEQSFRFLFSLFKT